MVAFRNPLLFSPKVFLCFPMLLFPGELFIANVLRWTLFLTPPLYLLIYCVSHFSTRTPFLCFRHSRILSLIFPRYSGPPPNFLSKIAPLVYSFCPFTPSAYLSCCAYESPFSSLFPSLFPCAKFSPLFPLSLPLCQS